MNLLSTIFRKKSSPVPPPVLARRQPLPSPVVTDVVTATVDEITQRFAAIRADDTLDERELLATFSSAVEGIRSGALYEAQITPILLLLLANNPTQTLPYAFSRELVVLRSAKIIADKRRLSLRFDAFTRGLCPPSPLNGSRVWSPSDLRKFRVVFTLTTKPRFRVELDGELVQRGDLADQICPCVN